MIENREYTISDYLAMLRRRLKMILIPALMAPLPAFLVSYKFPPKYTSQSTVLVEGQKVPENMVQPVVSEEMNSRMVSLQQQVLSDADLQPMVERLYPGKSGQEVSAIIEAIRVNMVVEPVDQDLSSIGSTTTKKKPSAQQTTVPAFYVKYTTSNAREAQQICGQLTSLMVDENLKLMQSAARGTSDVLGKGLDDAKTNLDGLDAKLAEFKKKYVGQLPGDEENNLKILMGLNSQLDANTQTLNRAQQDKSYTESLLAQQITAWKSSQSSTNPETLEKQLSDMQSQLLQLQAHYTDDHPDVIKAKADIAELKKKLAEINQAAANPSDSGEEKASASEPPEIRQLRLQIHQYEDLIAQTTRDQKKLQQEINVYQGRVASSPAVEEQYKELARDYDNAQKVYQDDLAKQSTSQMATQAEQQQQGAQMTLLNPANLPDSPSFPNRLFFAGGGLGAGLVLGLGVALWLELRDNCIRTEADAEAALEIPMLVSVPWVVEAELGNGNSNGKGQFWKRKKPAEETARV